MLLDERVARLVGLAAVLLSLCARGTPGPPTLSEKKSKHIDRERERWTMMERRVIEATMLDLQRLAYGATAALLSLVGMIERRNLNHIVYHTLRKAIDGAQQLPAPRCGALQPAADDCSSDLWL